MQYNINVANGTGMEVRTNLNLAHQSLATNFFGATDPSLMSPVCAFPGSTWADTGNGLLKVRNADDSDWIVIGTIESNGTPKLGETAINTSELALNLRQPSTEYAVGDIAYSALLPSWAMLRCTTAGTTGSGDLPVPSTITEYGTITDGTVVWQIQKLADKLDTTGGTMTGDIVFAGARIANAVNNYVTDIHGGSMLNPPSGHSNGAVIRVFGREIAGTAGAIYLYCDDGVNRLAFTLKPDGTATWKGIPLESLGMPSTTQITLTVPKDTTWTVRNYTAATDGYVRANLQGADIAYSIIQGNMTLQNTTDHNTNVFMPVNKGTYSIACYSANWTNKTIQWNFIPTKGAL